MASPAALHRLTGNIHPACTTRQISDRASLPSQRGLVGQIFKTNGSSCILCQIQAPNCLSHEGHPSPIGWQGDDESTVNIGQSLITFTLANGFSSVPEAICMALESTIELEIFWLWLVGSRACEPIGETHFTTKQILMHKSTPSINECIHLVLIDTSPAVQCFVLKTRQVLIHLKN